MKLKIWTILFMFVILLASGLKCGPVAQDGDQMKFIGPGVDWLMKKAPKTYRLEELTEIFKKRNLELTTHYKNDEFEEIGKYYGDAGMVRTYYDNYVYGICAIANYFKELKNKKNVTEAKFDTNLVYIDVDEYLAKNPSPDYPDKDIVYTIHEIISISYDIEGRSPDSDTSSRGGGHSRPTFNNGHQ